MLSSSDAGLLEPVRGKGVLHMKQLFWIGILIVGLGVVSLFVPIPRTEHSGFTAGGMSVGIKTQHDEKVSPIVSGALLLAGAGMMIAGRSVRRA